MVYGDTKHSIKPPNKLWRDYKSVIFTQKYFTVVFLWKEVFLSGRRDGRSRCCCGWLDVSHLFLIPTVQPISCCQGHMNADNFHGTGCRQQEQRKPSVRREATSVYGQNADVVLGIYSYQLKGSPFVLGVSLRGKLQRLFALREEETWRREVLSKPSFLGCARWKLAYGKFVSLSLWSDR